MSRSLITFCSFGLAPRPPLPSGKCTHARPASNWAPRNSTGSVVFGSCLARSSSISAMTAASSVLLASASDMPATILDRSVKSLVTDGSLALAALLVGLELADLVGEAVQLGLDLRHEVLVDLGNDCRRGPRVGEQAVQLLPEQARRDAEDLVHVGVQRVGPL